MNNPVLIVAGLLSKDRATKFRYTFPREVYDASQQISTIRYNKYHQLLRNMLQYIQPSTKTKTLLLKSAGETAAVWWGPMPSFEDIINAAETLGTPSNVTWLLWGGRRLYVFMVTPKGRYK